MDEPLSNLDAALRVQTRADIVALQERLGTTTLYVTHDQVEAMTMGHRIAVLSDGVLQQVAAPQALYDRPANTFVAGFLGSPGMNLFKGTLADVDGTTVVRVPGGSIALGDDQAAIGRGLGSVTVGLRPEALALDPEGSFEATVILVEVLGAEVHVIASLADGTRFVVRQDAERRRPDLAEGIRVTPDPRRTHLFDAESGLRLGAQQ